MAAYMCRTFSGFTLGLLPGTSFLRAAAFGTSFLRAAPFGTSFLRAAPFSTSFLPGTSFLRAAPFSTSFLTAAPFGTSFLTAAPFGTSFLTAAPFSTSFLRAAPFGTSSLRAAPFAVYRTYSGAGGFWKTFSFGKPSKEPVAMPLPEPGPPVVLAPTSPPSLSYNPPAAADLEALLSSVLRAADTTQTGPADWRCQDITSEPGRTQVLTRLARDLGRTVPGSQLHEMRRGEDVERFYSIPVRDNNRLEEMAIKELPANIKINWDYE